MEEKIKDTFDIAPPDKKQTNKQTRLVTFLGDSNLLYPMLIGSLMHMVSRFSIQEEHCTADKGQRTPHASDISDLLSAMASSRSSCSC